MAEIHVEHKDKNRNPIWPWILGALVLIGLIWGVSELLDNDDDDLQATRTENTSDRGLAYQSEEDRVTNSAVTGYEAQGPVNDFLLFVNQDEEEGRLERANVSDRNTTAPATDNATNTDAESATSTTTQADQMGLDHEYTSEGIRKLSAALNALATNSNDPDLEQKRQTFQQHADKIQQDPASLQHANTIRETFVEAASLMAAIKERSYPESTANVDEVREAAEDLEASEQTLEQKEEVREFFQKSGEAIQAMDEYRVQNSNMNNRPDQNQPNNP